MYKTLIFPFSSLRIGSHVGVSGGEIAVFQIASLHHRGCVDANGAVKKKEPSSTSLRIQIIPAEKNKNGIIFSKLFLLIII